MEYHDNSASRLVDSDIEEMLYFSGHVHIHLHTVTPASYYDDEDGVCELCCHGCGSAAYVIFNMKTIKVHPKGHPSMSELKDEFIELHAACCDKIVSFDSREFSGDDFKTLCLPQRGKTITVSVKC